MPDHNLHQAVAGAVKQIISADPAFSGLKPLYDEACGISPRQHLPFFLSVNKGNDTEITNVDLLILKDHPLTKVIQTVKLICEIEESDITPVRTYGKIFTAASAIMCQLSDDTRYDLDKNGVFVQVLSNFGLDENSKKEIQGKNIENAIRAMLKSNCSWIKEYHLIYGDVGDFVKGKLAYHRLDDIIRIL